MHNSSSCLNNTTLCSKLCRSKAWHSSFTMQSPLLAWKLEFATRSKRSRLNGYSWTNKQRSSFVQLLSKTCPSTSKAWLASYVSQAIADNTYDEFGREPHGNSHRRVCLDLTKRRERTGHVQECPKHHERWFRQWLGGNVKKTCSAKSFPVRLKIQTLLFLNNNYGNDTVITSVMRQFRECGRCESWAISRPGKSQEIIPCIHLAD